MSERPIYPSFEDAIRHPEKATRPIASKDFLRLRWTLDGPIETAISVLDDLSDIPGPRQPYQYLATTQQKPTLHSISQSPAYEPKVSSINVKVYELDQWQDSWRDTLEYVYPGDEGSVFEGTDLLEYLGEKKPPPGPILTVKASGSYVTIHDYVLAVHPWLMDLKENIIAALDVGGCDQHKLQDGVLLNMFTPDMLFIIGEQDWQRGLADFRHHVL